MNARSYQGLGIWSALTAVGFGLALAGRRGQGSRGGSGRAIALVLTFSATLSALGYLWWNVSFVQHQGRYLYPALIPLGLAAGIAWEHLAYDRTAQGVAGLCLLVSIGLLATGQRFFALLVAGAAGLLWLNSRLSIRFRWLLPALASAGLAGLALLSLFLFVIPWLN